MLVISPTHPAKRAWNLLVLIVTIFVALEVPLRLALSSQTHLTGFLFTKRILFDVMVTGVFAADIVLTFVTAVERGGERIADSATIRQLYLGRWFVVDLIATLPFDFMATAFLDPNHKVVGALSLLRLVRCAHLVQLTLRVGQTRVLHRVNPGVVRMGAFFFWIFLIAHWVACGWLALGAVDRNLDVTSAYVQALYWCVTTLTTVGYGDITPRGNIQLLYTMAVEVLGVGVYGYIIGNVANLVANLDVQRSAHTERLNAVNAYLQFHGVPLELRERITEYFQHIYENRINTGGDAFIADLPPSLRADLVRHLNSDIIKRVPFFEQASEAFITEFGLALREVVFTPGDAVISYGEIGDSMYFVATGKLDVVAEDGTTVAELGPGDFFGEMALLSSQPRNATIIAKGYCHLFTVDAETFQRVILRFPAFAQTLRAVAHQREEVSGVHRLADLLQDERKE